MKPKILSLVALVTLAALTSVATAQTKPAAAAKAEAKLQFFPGLPYRTGPFAPNGVPWANGYSDYLKLINAKGGINGVKIIYEECETGYDTARGVECYERLKGKHGGATVFQPLSTGITFALTEKAPGDKIPLITAGYGRSESQDGTVFKWNFPWLVPIGWPLTCWCKRSVKKKVAWTNSKAKKSPWSTTTRHMAKNLFPCCKSVPPCMASHFNCCQ